jgi:hypothetical protein
MALRIEDDARRARDLLDRRDVQEAMSFRCEEEGHAYEGCCSVFLRVYQACKWCGQEKGA